MNLFGFAISEKALELIEHEWTYNRTLMIIHLFRRLLEFALAAFIGAMAGVGVLLYMRLILGNGEAFELVSYIRTLIIISYSAAAVFLLCKLSRDFYYAAELGYESVFDYQNNSKPEVRLMKMREESGRGNPPAGHE